MQRERRQARVFEEVADTYDAVRPGYPEALFDHVMAWAGLREGDRALEVGAGTGKATLSWARRGLQLLCLEPGAPMAELLRRNCAAWPRVRVEPCSLEEWRVEEAGFDLVTAAQAWHWVAPEADWKAAAALRDGGAVALLWNRPVGSRDGAQQQVDAVFEREAPEIASRLGPGAGVETWPMAQQRLAATGGFEPAQWESFDWEESYDTETYLRLMSTQSSQRLLEEAHRERLHEALRRCLESLGGGIHVHYATKLCLARRRMR